MADGTRADMQRVGGARETAVPGDGGKGAKRGQGWDPFAHHRAI
jgi:hypothetical protein